MKKLVRSFISIDLEERETVKKIIEVQRKLFSVARDIKLVEPQNLHLTLVFLGELSEEEIRSIYDSIREIEFLSPFSARLVGLGAFPSSNRPRVLWIGVGKNEEKIVEIYKEIIKRINHRKFPDKEKFIAHLTIGRIRRPRRNIELSEILNSLGKLDIGEMEVNDVKIKKSTLTPKGPVYTTLFKVSLLGREEKRNK